MRVEYGCVFRLDDDTNKHYQTFHVTLDTYTTVGYVRWAGGEGGGHRQTVAWQWRGRRRLWGRNLWGLVSTRLSCHVRSDVSLTSADVRSQVTWRNWRNCGSITRLRFVWFTSKFVHLPRRKPPWKQGMSRIPLSSFFYPKILSDVKTWRYPSGNDAY